MKMTGWAWDHAKCVADRCAERFESREEIEMHRALQQGLSARQKRKCAGLAL